MSLMQHTLLTGLILLLLGAILAFKPGMAELRAKAFPRSKTAALMVFGGASVWFLMIYVANLGPADFGEYRNLLFAGFAAIAILSFFRVPDFLTVQKLTTLLLLYAAEGLGSAYGMPQAPRLFLVCVIYLSIVVGLYLAAVPYRLRDFFGWLFENPLRARLCGGFIGAYGLLLLLVALTY